MKHGEFAKNFDKKGNQRQREDSVGLYPRVAECTSDQVIGEFTTRASTRNWGLERVPVRLPHSPEFHDRQQKISLQHEVVVVIVVTVAVEIP